MRPKTGPFETGAVVKDPGGKVSILLVFPNSYFVGMSNLGLHAIYASLNSLDFVRCERAFIPEEALRGSLSAAKAPRSIESGSLPSRFDAIAFSVPFENDYPNVVRFLRSSGIDAQTSGRSSGQPLVLAGGCAVTANPEPLAEFVDAFFIGDGEDSIKEFAAALFAAKRDRQDLPALQSAIAEIEGVYLPGLFQPHYNPDGTIEEVRALGNRKTVIRRSTSRQTISPCRTAVFTTEAEFGHLGLIEAVRGCPRECAFCLASYSNRPARFVEAERVLSAAADLKHHRQSIGLVGSAVSDHPQLAAIFKGLLEMNQGFTVSSLRADQLSTELLELLHRGGQKTITIAPEAGSFRLREALGKSVSDESLVEAASLVCGIGFSMLKLYFMVGLPGETSEDIEAIASLVKRMKHGMRSGSSGKRELPITVSISSFVPKAQTPLQWAPMQSAAALARSIKAIKLALRGVRGVSVHSDIPKWAYVQGVLSRGDRRCSKLVSALAETDFDWQSSRMMVNVNPDFYAARTRGRDEVFPWTHIDSGVSHEELLRRYDRFQAAVEGT